MSLVDRYFGIKFETTWGTYVAPTHFTDIAEESIEENPNREILQGINWPTGWRWTEGKLSAAGTVRTPCDTTTAGYWFKAVLGRNVVLSMMEGVIGGASVQGAYMHVFWPRGYNEVVAKTHPSFSVCVGDDALQERQYSGVLVNKLTMDCEPGKEVEFSADLITEEPVLIDITAVPATNEPGDSQYLFQLHHAWIMFGEEGGSESSLNADIAGVDTGQIEKVSISINNNFDDDAYGASKRGLVAAVRQALEIEITLTQVFDSYTEMQRFYGGGPIPAALEHVNVGAGAAHYAPFCLFLEFDTGISAGTVTGTYSDHHIMKVFFPRCIMTACKEPTSGRDRRKYEITIKALTDLAYDLHIRQRFNATTPTNYPFMRVYSMTDTSTGAVVVTPHSTHQALYDASLTVGQVTAFDGPVVIVLENDVIAAY